MDVFSEQCASAVTLNMTDPAINICGKDQHKWLEPLQWYIFQVIELLPDANLGELHGPFFKG